MRTWAPTLLLATSVFCAGLAHAGDRRPILLTPERVWTGDGAPQRGWAVLVANGRIEAAGPADQVQAPQDAERIDLPGKTLIPGMIDLHSHVLLHPYNETTWDDQVIKEPVAYRIMLAAKHAADRICVRPEPYWAARYTPSSTASSPKSVVNLMTGFIATDEVSLNGSPTVSPTTEAACSSVPFILSSVSTIFFALSQAPPALAMKIA